MITGQQDYYISLIERLRRLPAETEWLEYKSNNTAPQMIGEYISAISNSAALERFLPGDGEEGQSGIGELACRLK